MFETVMLLLGPWLVFRLLGMLGVARFATWRTSGAHALAAMLLCTGTAHFVPDSVTVMPSHADLTAMVPPFVPFPHLMVYATGVLELLGALGLARTATRPAAGIGLAALFVAMFPANVYAAIENVPLNGDPATPLWFRVPEQILFITIAFWASRPTTSATAHREPVAGPPHNDPASTRP